MTCATAVEAIGMPHVMCGMMMSAAPADSDKAPEIGAVLPGNVPLDIRYRHHKTNAYSENPRVVQMDWPPAVSKDTSIFKIEMFFSVPIKKHKLKISVQIQDGGKEIQSNSCSVDKWKMSCTFPAGTHLSNQEPFAVYIPWEIEGKNGENVTDWAAEPNFVMVRGKGT